MKEIAKRTVFFGTPAIAVPFLELLARKTQVVGVVSQPDKPAGRELKVQPTPVKAKALELGLPHFTSANDAPPADFALVVAYGRLIKRPVLDRYRLGCVNVHFSLLPKYRGAAPVQWALARGEQRTGVTLFWLDEGMDTGPILAQAGAPIGPDDDAGQLLERLTALGLETFERALADLSPRVPQAGEPSLAPLIKREDARLDFSMTAAEAHNKVRGFRLWPRAALDLPSGRLLVLKTLVDPGQSDAPPGTIVDVDRSGGFLVQFGSRSRLWFLSVQPEGKKQVSAAEFLNGLRLGRGELLR